jgi:SAM-dependent methyltransferase
MNKYREYTDKKYIELVEKTAEPVLREHMKAETEEILNVETPQNKTFIDLGAGHGRVLQLIAARARNVISVELNPDMLPELERRTGQFDNAEVVVGDMTKLSEILKGKDLKNPVLLLLQNTLGTIEGDAQKVLSEMKEVAQTNQGELIISFNRAEALRSWGVSSLYPSVSAMVGEPDLERTDFEHGIFVSKTGYTSKWRSAEEIEKIKQFFQGQVVNEIRTNEFCVVHIQYRQPE